MSKKAIYAELEARRGKEAEVEAFLKSALPLVNAEPGTETWFAIKLDNGKYGIFDTFEDETGRNAHLNGKVAAALMAKASELFAQTPAIHKLDVLAEKLPK
jgi:quinol monooxygenase YgiN